MPNFDITDADIEGFLDSYNKRLDVSDHLVFCDKRRGFIKSWGDVQACPGSGKTTLIAAKLIILAKKWSSKYQGICVLTHTNVACDEIRARLESDSHGHKLLSYPHFIGTIQEFVNRFLAIPSIKSMGLPVDRIDDEVCVQFAQRHLNQGTVNFLERKRVSLSSLRIDRETGDWIIPGFQSPSTSSSYTNLKQTLQKRVSNGLFCYSEMYFFAQVLLEENCNIPTSLQKRFPVVIIDEMQDTQKFQDELVNNLFATEKVCMQRFGDPDQAIYDRIGGEEPNETFNRSFDLEILAHSHRFSQDIAIKLAKLSLNQIGLIAARANPTQQFQHTVFIYDDSSQNQVLEAYTRLIQESDPEYKWRSIKAVGAVGQSEGHNFHVKGYWNEYDRKNKHNNSKPSRLIDVINSGWASTKSTHSGAQYKLIVQTILDALRMGQVMDSRVSPSRHFSSMTLKTWLNENNKMSDLRQLIAEWVLSPPESESVWQSQIDKLMSMLDLPNNIPELNAFLAYSASAHDPSQEPKANSNIYTGANGRSVEVGTIHSVKGETHDATLVLETRFHDLDIHKVLDYIAGIEISKISGIRKMKFARQLYVACSRPRHLLCLAIHKNSISSDQLQRLESSDIGWNINDLSQSTDE